MRDLVIKDDDLVVGTHGRGIWILDDITPLRQIAGARRAASRATRVLFKPQPALRVRWNMNTDTPMPPDEPAAPNPPEGAIIDYYLKSAANGPVTLEIIGGTASSCANTRAPTRCSRPIRRPPRSRCTGIVLCSRCPRLPACTASRGTCTISRSTAGGRRDVGGPNLPIAAIGHNTVPAPTTPWVNPGHSR